MDAIKLAIGIMVGLTSTLLIIISVSKTEYEDEPVIDNVERDCKNSIVRIYLAIIMSPVTICIFERELPGARSWTTFPIISFIVWNGDLSGIL